MYVRLYGAGGEVHLTRCAASWGTGEGEPFPHVRGSVEAVVEKMLSGGGPRKGRVPRQ